MAWRPITWAAPRSSSARWVAITVSRSRELPSGTVGGRIAWAKTPSRSARSQSAVAVFASPTISGTIWVREPPTSRPSAASDSRRVARVAAQLLDHVRARLEHVESRERGADRRRRRRGRVDERPGGVDEQLDQLGRGAGVGAVAAERLAERADDHVDLAGEPGGGDRPASAGPERAGAVRLVDHQQAVVAAGELDELAQRRDVAVHREDAVGDDQPRVGAGLAQAPLEVLDVAVAVDEGPRAGEPAAVDDAGVVELVGEDDATVPARAATAPVLAR